MAKDESTTTTTGLITYPADLNNVLELYCTAYRKVHGNKHRPPKAQVLVHFFKAGGLSALQSAVQELEAQLAKIPPKVPGRRGRPKGSGKKLLK